MMVHMSTSSKLGVGIGLRAPHVATMLATRPVLMDDPGEDAFPGAAFSLNQNRRAGPRSFPGELEGFRDRGTVADEIVLKGAHDF